MTSLLKYESFDLNNQIYFMLIIYVFNFIINYVFAKITLLKRIKAKLHWNRIKSQTFQLIDLLARQKDSLQHWNLVP